MDAAVKKLHLQSSTAHNYASGASAAAADGKKIFEEMYQKKTQLEHILLRPDTYISSVEKHTQTLWIYENEQMVHRHVAYVPGLYKIFDEILVNAADNKQRDPTMDSLMVDIDADGNCISIYNNGEGVPIEIHQEEGVYVPEMIFGHLLMLELLRIWFDAFVLALDLRALRRVVGGPKGAARKSFVFVCVFR